MGLTAKLPQKKQYELPKDELTQAVCAFIVDCGQHEETNERGEVSLKHKLCFLFELEQLRSDGKRFVMNQRFTNSLHKKSNLRPFLEKWLGKAFTDAEVEAGFDLTQLVGRNCYITPVLKPSKGVVYANIGSITKLRDRDTPIEATMTSIPQWVSEYIAKAAVPPDSSQEPAGTSAESDLPWESPA